MTAVEPSTTWFDSAACLGVDPDLFFPELGDDTRSPTSKTNQAIAICHTCPVEADCLHYAITTRQKDGVWGGKSARQRQNLRNVDRLQVELIKIRNRSQV